MQMSLIIFPRRYNRLVNLIIISVIECCSKSENLIGWTFIVQDV